MRVLYFSESYCGHDHRFVTSVANAGNQVYYARLYNTPVDLSPLENVAGVTLVDIEGIDKKVAPLAFIQFATRFKMIAEQIAPDVIHAGPVDRCGAIAALGGLHPLVVMSWGYDLMKTTRDSKIRNLLARIALRNADQFTSDAIATKQEAIRMGMDPQKCTTFPWGVDIEHYHPAERELGSDKTITLFCNRSWELNYGVDVLAKAFSLVAKRAENISLLLLGSGSMEEKLREIFSEAGTLDRVEFAGRISQQEQPKYYQRADIYITPSHVDGTSVSLMEAMACGLPVIASNIPGNVDWVKEGEHGWLFKDGDVDDLVEKIELAISRRGNLGLIGEKCRSTAETRADWNKNLKVLLSTYQNAIKEHNKHD